MISAIAVQLVLVPWLMTVTVAPWGEAPEMQLFRFETKEACNESMQDPGLRSLLAGRKGITTARCDPLRRRWLP